jgi:hypothetical protein
VGEEIRKWKQSAINALKQPDLDWRSRGQFSMAAALWEVALQMAVWNEREAYTHPERQKDLVEVKRAILSNSRAIRGIVAALSGSGDKAQREIKVQVQRSLGALAAIHTTVREHDERLDREVVKQQKAISREMRAGKKRRKRK